MGVVFVRDVTEALEQRHVRYAVVGGVAVNLYGIPRTTFDLDIVVIRDAESLRRCREALESLGLRCRLPLVLESLADERGEALDARSLIAVTFTDPNDPLREVDVLVNPPIDAYGLIERARLVAGKQLELRLVALDDLIALKRAASRAQDLADLEHLLRLTKRAT